MVLTIFSPTRSSFSDFSTSRYARDERWKAIEKMRERENLFNDYQDELRRKEKDEKHQKKEQVREVNPSRPSPAPHGVSQAATVC
jgi:hypothetical protein